MGCWGSEGHREDKSRILGISLYLVAVNDALIRFLDEGVEDNQFHDRVKSVAEFISIVGADFSEELRKRYDRLSTNQRCHYGFREDDQSEIRYAHVDVFRHFIELHKYRHGVLEVVRRLRSVLDRRTKIETRKTDARFCLEFLYQFNSTCLHQFHYYEPSIPRGIRNMFAKNSSKKDRLVKEEVRKFIKKINDACDESGMMSVARPAQQKGTHSK